MSRLSPRLGVVVWIGMAVGGPADALAGFGTPLDAKAGAPVAPGPTATGDDTGDRPAARYARLERDACESELARRGASFVRVDGARGVREPLRLTGPLHGVSFHSGVSPRQRASSPWEIVDCRLALALDDFALQLSGHDVVDVLHYSIYRPPPSQWPTDKVAKQHGGGLAIDAATFTKSDGTKLDVERDFHGQVGAPTCGPGTGPSPATPEALELRDIVCAAAEAKIFNVALTPDYNRAHFNHFHLEVTAGARWFMVR
jgi:hypothetical protein